MFRRKVLTAMSELRKKRREKEVKEWIISIVVVVIIALIVRNFIVCPVMVKGSSMEPNFHHGDIVLANRFEYIISEPERDDIVICDYSASTGEKHIIKRVIGVEGDTIDFQWTDHMYYKLVLNGEVIDEDYTKEDMYFIGDMSFPYTVPEDCYFVMGDNRNDSNDSRYVAVGAIKKSDMIGKVFVSVKPFRVID